MATQENPWQEALAAVDLSAIDSLKTLKHEQDVLDERLQAMDGLKSEVATAVYLRVRDDYLKRRRALEEQAMPLRQSGREQYAKLRALLDKFEADHEAIKLDQQELELRHKLKEFDEKEFQRRIKAIESAVKEKAEARARALELKTRFLEAFHTESELETGVPASEVTNPGIANASVTRPSSAVTDTDVQNAIRTHEVPALRSGEPPGKTQVMPAVDVPDLPPSSTTTIFRAARLVPQNPEAGKQAFTLSLKPTNLGADSGNDVRIGGPGVDPKHAQITVSMGGFTLVDLGSKHGTRVNAEKVRERQLRHEDVIQIGAARFIFREG
jgi:FHA domain